ncbi:MAG: endo alpha-1,4 polygalactosaminidase [Myxococcales bacterium]|nr:endo alpha-1,4 polygalactosaminidase [Myxococcales bacterium]
MRALLLLLLLPMIGACSGTEGPLLVQAGSPDESAPDAGDVPSGGPVEVGMTLQYQLVGALDEGAEAELFVIDLFERSGEEIARLHARGRVVLAYVAAGSHEPWRPDADAFPAATLGNPLPAYPDERWLDVRDPTVRQLQRARMELARDKGFDGLVLTGLDAYGRDSGHALSADDQLDYNLWLAAQAHALALSVGLASAWAQAEALAPEYDFAIHIDCLAENRCAELEPYRRAGRPVFDLETAGTPEDVCAQAASLGLPVTLKRASFDAWLHTCP